MVVVVLLVVLTVSGSLTTAPLAVHSSHSMAAPSRGMDDRPVAGPLATSGSAIDWKNVSPSTSPTPEGRNRAVFVHDPADHLVLLFGGYDALGAGWLGDTWTLAGGNWTPLSPSSSPSARSSASAAYDPALSGVVVFGGFNYAGTTYFNDTWLFAAGNWTNISGSVEPSARSEAPMAYDPILGELVLFGGRDAAGLLADTWGYTAAGWHPLSTSNAPPQIAGATMVYDANTSVLVLFGGTLSSGDSLGTWAFNGDWSSVSTAQSPGGEYLPMMTTLPNGSVVLAAPQNSTVPSSPLDLWELGASGWVPIATLHMPSSRASALMTFDSTDGYPLLFGGRDYSTGTGTSLNDVWALDSLTGRFGSFPLSGVAPWAFAPTASLFGGVVNPDGTSSVSYLWSFGDGGTSAAAAPQHTYGADGPFPVILVLRDGFGLSVSISTNVSVGFHLTIGYHAVNNESLTFAFSVTTANATAPLSFVWSFGDGTSDVTAAPTHTFPAAGAYTVEARVGDANHETTWANQTVTANATPAPKTNATSSGSGSAGLPVAEFGALAGAIAIGAVVGLVVGRRRAGPPDGT